MVDGGDDDSIAWNIDKHDFALLGFNVVLEAWVAWEFQKVLPFSGGMLEQPLALMIKLNALSFVYNTWKSFRSKDVDFSKFSATQKAVIKWMETDG